MYLRTIKLGDMLSRTGHYIN